MGTRDYSDDFKRHAVHQIAVRGYRVREVSTRLGVSAWSLYKWLKVYGAPASKQNAVDHEAENRRLKRDLARVAEERDILKKGNGELRARVPMKHAFMRAHREEFAIRAMCRVLRVHFSGVHAWLKEPMSLRARDDVRQTELIGQAWTESGKVCGCRKLADDLCDLGDQVSKTWVARLAGLASIAAQIGCKRRPGRYGGKPAVVAYNALDRQFEFNVPDKVCLTVMLRVICR